MTNFANEFSKLGLNNEIFELFQQSLEYYKEKYGDLLKLPDRYHIHNRLTSHSIDSIHEAINIIGIKHNQHEYYWLAKLYLVLPLFKKWSIYEDIMGKVVFRHENGLCSEIRPTLFYALYLKNIYDNKPDMFKKMKLLVQSNYANFLHLYKDPFHGKIVSINIKKELFLTTEKQNDNKSNEYRIRSVSRDRKSIEVDNKDKQKIQKNIKNKFIKTLTSNEQSQLTATSERNINRNVQKRLIKLNKKMNSKDNRKETDISTLSKPIDSYALNKNVNFATERIMNNNSFFIKLKKSLVQKNSLNKGLEKKLNLMKPKVDYSLGSKNILKLPKVLYNNVSINKIQKELLKSDIAFSFNKLFKSFGEVTTKRNSNNCPLTGTSLLSFNKSLIK